VIDLVVKACELVHTKQKEPYAIIDAAGVRQVLSIKSASFSEWVASRYYAEKKASLSDASLQTALNILSGKAVFEGRTVEVHTRIAKTEAGYWLDLCNDQWQAVRVDASGWQVVSGPMTPLFRRSSSMQPIPTPAKGGSLNELWRLINIPQEDRWLIVTWLLECLRPETPHVVLELVGEQGSAKSTTQKILKMLIDPNIANLRAAPKKVEDVWISACNSHLLSFENISFLGQEYQDALCVMATGGAHATRTHYSNLDETIIESRKPIVINGIVVNVTAQDLLDRSLSIELPPVERRLQSQEVTAGFEVHYPHLVGSLLDEFVKALSMLGSITIGDEDKPRMLDFAYLGEAVFRANGLPAGAFIAQYKALRQKGIERTIEASPIGLALLSYLQDCPDGWSGQLTHLLRLLDGYKPAGGSNWPRSAKALGDALRRLSPALRTLGFQCKSRPKQHGSIVWEIQPTPIKSSIQSPPSTPSPEIEGLTNVGSGHGGLSGHENYNRAGLIDPVS
jgi:hypothetical protein